MATVVNPFSPVNEDTLVLYVMNIMRYDRDRDLRGKLLIHLMNF